ETDGGDDEFGDETPPQEAAPAPADEDELRARRFRFQNTLTGPTGGIRLVDARAAAPQTFRLQLATEFFFSSDFLNNEDSNDRIGGFLSLSWAVHEFVEIFASISSYANSNDTEEPELFQVLGDTTLGAKVGVEVLPWLSLGGDVTLALLNTVGDIGLVFSSTSFGLRANATADFRGLPSPIPLVARLNLGYYFDNSEQLIEDTEQARFNALEDPEPIEDEDRHLITRVERFALNINRTDFFNFGLGVEVPLKATENFFISPMLEWTWSIPVNRQGYDCLFIPAEPGSDDPVDGADGCLDRQGLSAFPMRLTLGVRVLPPIEGLSVMAGVDIGLTGTSTFVRELAPTAPYNVMLALGYAYDTREEPPPEPVIQEVERQVEVQVPPPPKGRINGTVFEQGTETRVAEAIVAFTGQDLTSLVTEPDGTFTSYQFDPGEVQFTISHPEYNDGQCAATIAEEGGDVEVRCELVALPRLGTAAGRVTGEAGAAVSAQMQITGPMTRSVRSDAAGAFSVADLQPGTYTVRIEAENYLIKLQQFDVTARETTDVNIALVPRPQRPLVRVRNRDIQIRRQINFATDSAEILENSFALMTEIADVIIRNPELTQIEIQGHTDNSGSRQHNMDLSQRRAEAVRTWLVTHGVAATRLTAVGHGPDRPLVPNITPANRARNRRVQFVISARAE
ncbi:MAG: OmpA family protein, partial [Myxococcota bacterium]